MERRWIKVKHWLPVPHPVSLLPYSFNSKSRLILSSRWWRGTRIWAVGGPPASSGSFTSRKLEHVKHLVQKLDSLGLKNQRPVSWASSFFKKNQHQSLNVRLSQTEPQKANVCSCCSLLSLTTDKNVSISFVDILDLHLDFLWALWFLFLVINLDVVLPIKSKSQVKTEWKRYKHKKCFDDAWPSITLTFQRRLEGGERTFKQQDEQKKKNWETFFLRQCNEGWATAWKQPHQQAYGRLNAAEKTVIWGDLSPTPLWISSPLPTLSSVSSATGRGGSRQPAAYLLKALCYWCSPAQPLCSYGMRR